MCDTGFALRAQRHTRSPGFQSAQRDALVVSLAVRFIEEIDFDYAAVGATAALITAAS